MKIRKKYHTIPFFEELEHQKQELEYEKKTIGRSTKATGR